MVKSKKSKDISTFLIGIVIVVLLNIMAKQFFFRVDLTEENRYSMNEATEKMLERLDDQVYIEVFLEGDGFPGGFKRLKKAIKETLEEFRIYGGENIQYTFTDPMDFEDNKSRNQFHQTLAKKGIQPTNLFAKENGQKVEKILFPGALVRFGIKEIPVMLLKGQGGASAEEQLNNSIENIEYALADGIKKATQTTKKKIGVIEGHGEFTAMQTRSLEVHLKDYYEIQGINLPSKVNLDGFDLIIMARPDTFISEHDIFKLDQFIIKGGKAIFLIDPIRANLDSIGENGTYAFPYELGLTDMLFKYGVRLNNDLIQDFYCGMIPMFVGYVGNQPQTKLMPWRFYSVINQFADHPISKNLGPVRAKFVSTIDTVKAKGITKTPLLFTSKNSRIFPAPVRLNFNDARLDLDPSIFTKGPLPVGYALEGKFESVFKNKLTPETKKIFNYQEQGVDNKIVVFSDADLIRNEVSPQGDKILPLGYDKYTRVTFANKDLLLNTVDYLIDEDGLMQARTKEIELRPLDKATIKKDRVKWQIINLVIPILIILCFALIWTIDRKSTYKKFL